MTENSKNVFLGVEVSDGNQDSINVNVVSDKMARQLHNNPIHVVELAMIMSVDSEVWL